MKFLLMPISTSIHWNIKQVLSAICSQGILSGHMSYIVIFPLVSTYFILESHKGLACKDNLLPEKE